MFADALIQSNVQKASMYPHASTKSQGVRVSTKLVLS